jgi:hypothetical protein
MSAGWSVFWRQTGVAHREAATRARAAGLRVVENRCLKIDYAAYIRT